MGLKEKRLKVGRRRLDSRASGDYMGPLESQHPYYSGYRVPDLALALVLALDHLFGTIKSPAIPDSLTPTAHY